MPFGKRQIKAIKKPNHVHNYNQKIREHVHYKGGLGNKGKRDVKTVWGCECGKTMEV